MSQPNIKLNMQTNKAIRQLGRKGSLLQVAAADTVNEAAEGIEKNYHRKLERNQRLRARKFTLGSTKTFKANPVRSSGEPRQLHKINAITGVRKMRGGKEHYLAKLEMGSVQRGNRKTKNRVPIPLQASRTGQNIGKSISSPNRIIKKDTQTLRAGGRTFGLPGDGFRTGKQRFAALYNYKRRRGGNLQGDLKKPFFFTDNSNNLGIFKFIGGRARKIRKLDQTTARTRKQPNFEKAVDSVSSEDIKKRFVRKATALIGR